MFRLSILLLATTMAMTGVSVSALAQSAADMSAGPTELVDGPMKKLTPLLGIWEITDEWPDGQALWARNDYRVGIGGRFIEADTHAKDGDGKVYHRYRTMFGYDEEAGEYMTYGFTFDGTAKSVPMTVTEQDGILEMTSQWKSADVGETKQTVTVDGSDSYGWKVWMRSADGDWQPVMDGEWKRVDKSGS